jgi:nucleotide-binding universal stress UspA family protein
MTANGKILVATDLSAPSRHAVERAMRIAAGTGGEIHLLHAMELDALDGLRGLLGEDLSTTKARLEAAARASLAQLAAGSRPGDGGAVRMHFVSGNPLTAITGTADAQDAELVVVGARGESFLRHAVLGSTAVRLLRKSLRRPVLVVKQSPHEDYRCVLVAVDFSPASLSAIRLARRVAPRAELLLLHAFELAYESKLAFAGVEEQTIRRYIDSGIAARRRDLNELAANAGLSPTDYLARVIHGDPSQQIVAMEQEYNCDLVAVGKHGDHIAEEFLLGSVTKHVLADAQGDVLVIADPRRAEDAPP